MKQFLLLLTPAIHNFLLGIGNLINIPNNLMKNSTTGMYNGISIDEAKDFLINRCGIPSYRLDSVGDLPYNFVCGE